MITGISVVENRAAVVRKGTLSKADVCYVSLFIFSMYNFFSHLNVLAFFILTGKSDLTVDALKLHNELQTGPLELGAGSRKDARMEEEPSEALSERTSGTFLSGLSDCSNLTFRKVQRYWESNSAAHKEVGISGVIIILTGGRS